MALSDLGRDRLKYIKSCVLNCIGLEGEVAECGVAQGGSAKIISEAMSGTTKTLYLYDTYEGMPYADPVDVGFYKGKIYYQIEDTKKYLAECNNLVFVKGIIEETLTKEPERKYCFVHIDVDLYRATKYALEYFWPRLVDGGVLIDDDYGAIEGARKAVNEFVNANGLERKKLPTGQVVIFKGQTGGQ